MLHWCALLRSYSLLMDDWDGSFWILHGILLSSGCFRILGDSVGIPWSGSLSLRRNQDNWNQPIVSESRFASSFPSSSPPPLPPLPPPPPPFSPSFYCMFAEGKKVHFLGWMGCGVGREGVEEEEGGQFILRNLKKKFTPWQVSRGHHVTSHPPNPSTTLSSANPLFSL